MKNILILALVSFSLASCTSTLTTQYKGRYDDKTHLFCTAREKPYSAPIMASIKIRK